MKYEIYFKLSVGDIQRHLQLVTGDRQALSLISGMKCELRLLYDLSWLPGIKWPNRNPN